MNTTQRTEQIPATHGVVCDMRDQFFGYFGWPSVARDATGRLIVGASGLRHGHIGPFGKNVLFESTDEGATWTGPRVVHDGPLDDRDTGVVVLPATEGGSPSILISWFTADMKRYLAKHSVTFEDPEEAARIEAGLRWVTEERVAACFGSWVMRSRDGGITWSNPTRSPVTAPHGPILLADGRLLYLGKIYPTDVEDFGTGVGAIRAAASADGGESWELLGTVPPAEGTSEANYHEPHIVELPGGRLLGLIRVQDKNKGELERVGIVPFSLAQTVSDDGGRTFTRAEPLGFHGSPPHLLSHSSGAVVAVYGYRQEPYGQRVAITRDGGEHWEFDYILRDDGPDHDLGYPASVELSDGSILTVYYQKPASPGDKCGILWSRFRLP